MAVNRVDGQNQAMYMYQYQYRKGAQKGIGAIMQQLPTDQRQEISNYLQSLSETDRQNVVNQIKQLDYTSMTADQLYSSIMNIISSYTASSTSTSSSVDITA